jgi:hypothetical protein
MDDIKGERPASEAAGSPDKQPPNTRPKDPPRHGPLSRPDGMPGQRADLPEGRLPGPFLGPQGDENRRPPANAPAPVKPAPTVETPVKDR